jgi:hypothetical protein
MSRIERINDRFPRFYRKWEEGSLISILLQSIGLQLNETEERITDLMQAHWVDTAQGEELDKLGSLVGARRMPRENDKHLRAFLRRAVDEYKGGGTVSVIREGFKELIGTKNKEDIEIVENPLVEDFEEVVVIANDTWVLGSGSIKDEQSNLTLLVEGEGEVSNPQITNIDTEQSISYKGKLKSGEQLIIKQSRALLGDKDVTGDMIPPEAPLLLRKGSTWKYSESLSERIGVFDSGKFDEHTFAVGVPTVRVRFEWTKQVPATFVVQVKKNALMTSGLNESTLKKAANAFRAAGISVIIKVKE